jgi:hypothetical protein
VTNPEMKNLAWTLHQRYPAALDYLMKLESTPLNQIFDYVEELVRENSDFDIVWNSSTELWFLPKNWDSRAEFRNAGTKDAERKADGRLLLFHFWLNKDTNGQRSLDLYLGSVLALRFA